jgi:hypothetical protein
MYWILTNLQEMANDAEHEYVDEWLIVTVIIPFVTHMLWGGMW